MFKLTAFIIILLLHFSSAVAQKNPAYKFPKIEPAILQTKIYTLDSNANAIVLADVGSTYIIANTKGWFSYEFKRKIRTHILNKNGYNEATMEIDLYRDGSAEEKLKSLKAATYNLENGNLVETKLEKANVFTEEKSKRYISKKFTLPNIKEGSIIEIEYVIVSDFLFNLQPWAFQSASPRLWSDFVLSVPQFFEYTFISQGYHPFFIKDKKDGVSNFSVSNTRGASATKRFIFTSGTTDYRWVMKNVPELKEENFTSSISNYISKIEFQLSALKDPLAYQDVMGSWTDLTKKLLNHEDFGRNLGTNNNWLSDVIKPLLTGDISELEKARRIYAYVQNNITCTGHNAVYTTQALKNVLKIKSGAVSEVNLLLTAMLRYAGVEASPIMLSTKDHGFTYPIYPILNRFNYIIAQTTINNVAYTLDASQPRLGFGKLLPECYNGLAIIVNKDATPIAYYSDSLKERKITSVYIANDEKGNWMGTIKNNPGYYESYNIRDKIAEKGQENYFKDLKKEYGNDITISNFKIDSLTKYEGPVSMQYDLSFNQDKEDLLYISPMFTEGYKENPFKSAERFYPVEMPYTFDNTFLATIQIPNGYVVDEIPKSMKLKFNEEGEGYFEYFIAQTESTVSFRSRIQMKRATFSPDEYDILREFFNLIVSKQKEQIVFKKK